MARDLLSPKAQSKGRHAGGQGWPLLGDGVLFGAPLYATSKQLALQEREFFPRAVPSCRAPAGQHLPSGSSRYRVAQSLQFRYRIGRTSATSVVKCCESQRAHAGLSGPSVHMARPTRSGCSPNLRRQLHELSREPQLNKIATCCCRSL